MIINSAPQNEAVLSNVGEIGEFRIRNSAKAFNILSSGLYANKIKAIIRELSCNAVDSHAAAGKHSTPFDVHLPNSFEPWFSIRDYGTGLSHEQVTQIYTTYFESTKTNSNEFIGALGLGSKSPFSYTDNFTVTAIQSGKKGIYSAFINEAGVPSIAQMMNEETDEPAGVEVKFSVNDRYDFDKFRQEARAVYKYFKLQPVVSGSAGFTVEIPEYESKDIVPGVSQFKSGSRTVAIMGNIAYPVDVPQADQVLGELRGLLQCNLELNFAIGELDFQASREGLSYIPQTVNAIKAKLEALNAVLADKLAEEANAIPNLWDRAIFLQQRQGNYLWTAAVKKYAADTKLATYDDNRYGGTKTFKLGIEDLAKKFNITVRAFNYTKHSKAYPNKKSDTDYSDKRNANGNYDISHYWGVTVSDYAHFVVNDTKIGAVERAKYHYRETKPEQNNITVFVLDPADKTKPMKTKAFFKAIYEPREENRFVASAFLKKERITGNLKNVTILSLQERGNGGYYRQKEMVWRDAGKADTFDNNTTFYYLPLSGFNPISKVDGGFNVKNLFNDLKECGVASLRNQTIYGVRKGDLEFIKTQKNWINIEDHIAKELSSIDNKLVMSLVLQAVDNFNLLQYNSTIAFGVTDINSPYMKLINQFKGFEKIKYSEQSLKNLCRMYAKSVSFNPQDTVDKFVEQCKVVSQRYPLLAYLRSAPNAEVADYINVIDTQKGI
jgi:hypothetical protein